MSASNLRITTDCRWLIGMVHARALPGTPAAREPVDEIARIAAAEARTMIGEGFDAVIIENMHDRPYLRREVGPEIVAGMTRIGVAVRDAIGADVPLGVQILAGANQAALAVAQAIGANFIRAEGFVFASVADEGLLDEADAGRLLRYRSAIGAESIQVWCDIKKKHSAHALTADVDLVATAKAAEFFGADAVIVTGAATGELTSTDETRDVRAAVSIPVLAGSGATPDTIGDLFKHAHGVIVGSACKRNGHWANELDRSRLKALVQAAKG